MNRNSPRLRTVALGGLVSASCWALFYLLPNLDSGYSLLHNIGSIELLAGIAMAGAGLVLGDYVAANCPPNKTPVLVAGLLGTLAFALDGVGIIVRQETHVKRLWLSGSVARGHGIYTLVLALLAGTYLLYLLIKTRTGESPKYGSRENHP